MAVACFATAQVIGGSGFIAAFSGGLLFGAMAKEYREDFLRAAEGIGDVMALITWVIFGAAVVSKAMGNFSWVVVLYSILSLTLIRMLPVYFSVSGLKVNTEGKLFIGWFGPRGLASIVFMVIVVGEHLPDALAPGQNTLGFMLPYTPLHHLLMQEIDAPVVMTSSTSATCRLGDASPRQ